MATPLALPPSGTNNVWYHTNDSPSVVVFVHGILSDSRGCWLDQSGAAPTYWPRLVVDDSRLQNPSVFLGGFYTAIDAGQFGIQDCAKELLNGLSVPDSDLNVTPMEKKRIVFVCHSTGGIVVRYMLKRYREKFTEKEIGLVLMASPSYGAKLADLVGGLAAFYDNQLGLHLKWGNDVLRNLDDEFKELVDGKAIPNLVGIEACENHFVFHRKWLPDRMFVVEREAAGRYFAVRMLQNTDHFSIVKPNGVDHPSHKFLVEFWTKHYGPPLSQSLRDLLDVSKEGMRARNLPYFTPALLLALLHENGGGASIFESVRAGSAKEVRACFRQYIDKELPALAPGPFRDFDWFSREDICRAQKLALDAKASVISEWMLLKAVLLPPHSSSVEQIKKAFRLDFRRIVDEIDRRISASAATPGM